MSKRRISKQQKFRIQKIQDIRLARAQKSLDRSDGISAATDLGPEQTGLLITHHGKYVDVEGDDGKYNRCNIRQHLGALIAGDQVIWRSGKKNSGIVVALCDRQSLLWRPDERGEKKPIAANIDQIIVVIAPQPKPTLMLIDSYFVAAATVNINAILLLNKIDLISENDKAGLQNLLTIYGNIGYQAILATNKSNAGLHQLKSILKNRRSIFVGQSGVGKSTLIQHLMPASHIAIGELSLQGGHGTHTTSRSQLYHLPSGGDIIDSPGIREFGLWHMKADAVAQGFIEFREYLGQCKFNDCLHLNEPDCAILAAVATGKISKERYDSYLAITKSLEKNKLF